MRYLKLQFFLFLILGTVLILNSCNKKEISYRDVVSRLIDLERLAQLPQTGEKSGMFSSYDRRSYFDENEYINWSANDDGYTPQYIRKEGDNMVLAEMNGPGAIVRIWSASPRQGHVKIYIDNSETPLIDLPFIDYFNTKLLPAFGFPNLVYQTNARGYNNYVPITFQKSIKIVGEPGWGQYYHFNYITFPEGTKVEDFNIELTSNAKNILNEVDELFANKMGQPIKRKRSAREDKVKVSINPMESKNALTILGKRAITELKVNIKLSDSAQIAEIFRKTILSIKWDNNAEPSVWSPIGDFFGSSPGFNEYKTFPMRMTKDGMYSYWYMPFESKAELTVTNNTEIPIDLYFEVIHEKLPGNVENYGRFHAKWHRDIMPVEKERWPDWTVLKTQGAGRFVGMFLSVWNPKGGSCLAFGGEGNHWWGEGDEKFFVDNEKFPSTFGTGTEDYFGYAWCMPDFFEHAFHSQNYTEGNMGYQSLNRWQIIDNVPFQNSFEAYIEKYFPNEWPTQYATVAYWYLDKNGIDPIEQTPVSELFDFEIPYQVYYEKNAIEAEHMQITYNTGGSVSNHIFAHENLYKNVSGHKILVWNGKEDEENLLKTTFNLQKAGKYKVNANVILSNNGGIFEVRLNDKLLNKNLSFYQKQNDHQTRLVELGIVEVNSGTQELIFKWTEEHPGNRLAFDYIKFIPVM